MSGSCFSPLLLHYSEVEVFEGVVVVSSYWRTPANKMINTIIYEIFSRFDHFEPPNGLVGGRHQTIKVSWGINMAFGSPTGSLIFSFGLQNA